MFLFLFFKYCADVENCGASRGFGFIYIYIDNMTNWTIRLRKHNHKSTQHMSMTHHTQILNLTVRFEECNEKLILVNYGNNQTVGFRQKHGQSLVKVSQTWSNLIDGPETTRLGEIHIRILIIRIEEYGDILIWVKFENNWMVRLREHSHTGTQYMSITHNHQI